MNKIVLCAAIFSIGSASLFPVSYAYAQTMVPSGDASVNIRGEGAATNRTLEMSLTNGDGATSTVGGRSNGSGDFSYNAAILDNASYYSMGLNIHFQTGGDTLVFNLRYDNNEDDFVITATSTQPLYIYYKMPGDVVDRQTNDAGGRINITISGEDIEGDDNKGTFSFTFRSGSTTADPLAFNINIADVMIPASTGGGSSGGGGFDPAIVAGLAGMVAGTYGSSLKSMTDQISSVKLSQMMNIGSIMDSSKQIDTQRRLQTAKSDAVNRSRPSQQMCEIASVNQGKQMAESKAGVSKANVRNSLAANNVNRKGTMAGENDYVKMQNRFSKVMESGQADPAANGVSGYGELQKSVGTDKHYNAHVDAQARLAQPSVLKNVDFSDDVTTPEEENTMSLVHNLYGQDYPTIPGYDGYSLAPIQARDSIVNEVASDYVSKKTISHNEEDTSYMKAVYRKQGMSEDAIDAELGQGASLYAQQEILNNYSVYDADGVTDLGEGPAQIEQQRFAALALQNAQNFEILKEMHKREQLLAIILEAELQKYQDKLTTDILSAKNN